MKHFTHKKAEFSRAASLSKSDNTASNNSVVDTWCPELSKNGKCFFNFHHPTATTPTIPTNNPFLYFSQFFPPYFASLLVRKTITTNPMNTPYLYISAIFHFTIFTYTVIPTITIKNTSTSTIQPVQAVSRVQSDISGGIGIN